MTVSRSDLGGRSGGRSALRRSTARAVGVVAALVVAGLAGARSAPAASTVVVGSHPRVSLASAGTAGNLLSGDQSTFSSSTGGWQAFGATAHQVASPADHDPGSLELDATGASGMSAWSAALSPAGATAAATCAAAGIVAGVAGDVYSAAISATSPAGAVPVEPALVFCDGTTMLDLVTGPQTSAPSGEWQQTAPVVAVAPAGTTGVAMGLMVPSTTAGQQLFLDDAVLTGTAVDTPAVDGPLQVSGNHIVDGAGRTVVLRGLNLYGLEDSVDPPSYSAAQIADIRSWGATMVRVSLGEQLWLDTSCAYAPGYQNEVRQLVQWITQDGMVAMLDLHFSNPADMFATAQDAQAAASAGKCPPAGPMPMPDQQATTFWQQVASTFAGNPLVAFNLFNEPHDVSQSTWLDGGPAPVPEPVSGGPTTYPSVGMQQLTDVVRGTGASNLVVIDGNQYANEVPSQLVQGTNIVYSVHAYTCPDAPPPSSTCRPDPLDPSSILGPWVTFSATEPVMVGEFGWPDPYQSTYNANVIAFAEAHGWSWDVFAWDGTPSAPFSILAADALAGTSSAGGPGSPFEASPSGMPALCAMAYGGDVVMPSPCATPGPSPGISAAAPGTTSSSTPPGTTQSPAPGTTQSPAGGYWLVARDGGVFAFGAAGFFGSVPGLPVSQRPSSAVVGLVPSPGGRGYWEVTSSGDVYSFGDASFSGSTGAMTLAQPIVGMATS